MEFVDYRRPFTETLADEQDQEMDRKLVRPIVQKNDLKKLKTL